MAECEKCINESRISALEKDGERNSTQHREFYNNFKDIAVKQEVSDNTMQNMFSVLSEIKNDVKELKEKPVKKWDNISTYTLTAIIGTILGYFFSVVFK